MTATTTTAELYLQKAEQFEVMAQIAHDASAKAAYRYLAFAYRQLGLHLCRSPIVDTQPDDVAGRNARGKNAS